MSRTIRTAAVALVMAFSAAAAQAGEAPLTISVADIDISTAEGAKTLKARTEAAARQYCKETGPGALSRRAACRQNIAYEVNQEVAERQLAMKARATALAQAEVEKPSRKQ